MSLLKVNKVSPQSGTDFTLGDSGDTFTVPSGATLTVAGTFTQTGAQTFDGGVDIDNFNINGTTITLSSGDMTLDVAGDIVLDADGGDVFVKDGGTTFGSLTNTSGNLIIKSGTTTALTFSGANVTGAGTLQGTTITATTAFVPDASDGAALGTTALEFSDLFLADASTVQFGADQDVTLTHVADTGLLLNTASVIQFRDSAINIGSPADGDLDINADDEIELNSTLIDINGNVEISGTAVTTGVHTFTAVPVFPNNTVESADIQADAITGAKIADDAINSEHYTDGSIDTAHIADAQITAAKLASGVVGITMADQWRISANQELSTAAITANLEQVDDTGVGFIGSAMTVSSGVFTFPATGIYRVEVNATFSKNSDGGGARYMMVRTQTTTNNSTYANVARAITNINDWIANTVTASCASIIYLDVTNTSNVKVKFTTSSATGTDHFLDGTTADNYTTFTFTRLGDT